MLVISLPAVVPNFIVVYVTVLPAAILPTVFWATVVAIQTWLLLFPAWGFVQLLHTDISKNVSRVIRDLVVLGSKRVAAVAQDALEGHGWRATAPS